MDKMGALDHSGVKFGYFKWISLTVPANLKQKDKVVSCLCAVICPVSYSSRAGHACHLAYIYIVCSVYLSMDKQLLHCSGVDITACSA